MNMHERNKREEINTFSIVGFDPETGELGVAVASKFLAVGAIVPWAKAGVGAVATQSWANTDYGTKGLELLAQGMTAQQVLDQLVAEDEGRLVRQVGMVDAKGNSATYTGEECHAWAGGITGPNFAAQGNILVDEQTVQAMAQTFQSAAGSLAERLLAALQAGEDAGGDSRGKQSAALLIVKEGGGYGGKIDKYIDLRVDDHLEPVRELNRLFYLHQLYFTKPRPEDFLEIDEPLRKKLQDHLVALGYLTAEDQQNPALFFEKLHEFQLIENFDERIAEAGKVDKKVVEFMEQLAAKKG
ncbi:DUF1028 domain-containing protein [Brevibacillus fulvus]|uniref:Ntn-hydrolase superfamily protein n=2 Tax=Brevibacillus fulvus TaxID=1125967 RepID=A0A939BTP7_9BACL|nr:DUF1028 domain-containing protein [Brevibacillus fulvus]MBM7591738.1 putative Ntn-hydrolase superfamily protein [Brevibacillus fulvus]